MHVDEARHDEQDVPMDEDDLFLYTSNKPAVAKQVILLGLLCFINLYVQTPVAQKNITFNFTVIDKLFNNAPCKVLRVATATDVQVELQNDNKDIFFDLVTFSEPYIS